MSQTPHAAVPSSAVPSSAALGAIGQIAITLQNVPAAVTFYRDVLGLPLLFTAGEQLAFLQAGDVRLMLTTPQGAGAAGQNSVLYFRVTNIVQTYQQILAQGARGEQAPQCVATMPDHQLWLGFIRDLEGNLIGMMEELRF
jgi:predicted enzyme related to lactoylglutathione lyase